MQVARILDTIVSREYNIVMKRTLLFLVHAVIIARAVTFPLSFLRFDGGATIASQSHATLDSLALFLKSADFQVEVAGHTDNVGNPDEKMLVSQARAQAVCEYLVTRHDISRENLMPVGYGPSMPIASNMTEKGRAQNNRIEIKILSSVPAGRIVYMAGEVLIRKKGISDWTETSSGQLLTTFDEIRTGDAGRVSMDLGKAGKVFVSSNSTVSIAGLSHEQNRGELRVQSGKASIRQKGALHITTPLLSLQCRAAELAIESRPLHADFISVWKGSVVVYVGGDSFDIPAGYGVRCFAGYAPERPRLLSPAPEIDPLTSRREFYYDGDSGEPFAFHFHTMPNAQSHVMVTRDADFEEVIFDTVTSRDSCRIPAEDSPAIFLMLSTIDSLGLESKPSVHDFVVRKAGGPRLTLTNTKIEPEDNSLAVFLDGYTDPNCVLTINNEPVPIGKDGRFSLKARVKSGTKNLVLTATSPVGKTAMRIIPLGSMPRLMTRTWCGAVDLVGGNFSSFMTSDIGVLFGASIAYRIMPRTYLGAFMDHGAVSGGGDNFQPDTIDYRTTMTMINVGMQYYVKSNLYTRLNAGITVWKSFADDGVLDWGVDPFAGIFFGYEQGIAGRVKLFMELGADYIFNKTHANLGSDVYYIVPKAYAGVGL